MRLCHRHCLFQVRLDPFDVLVGLSNYMVDRRFEPAVGRHLVADVASRTLRHISGDFRVQLRGDFKPPKSAQKSLKQTVQP